MTAASKTANNLSDPAAVTPAPRLHYIDGLRAIAILIVLLYHCAVYSDGWQAPGNVFAFTRFGYIGVNLFLVLSGFCLYWPFVKQGARKEPTLLEFAKKRCRRILPPYYVALLIFWALLMLDVLTHHHYHEDATSVSHVVKSLFWHLGMIYNLRPEYIISINGPFWSLALEFSLYILFPLLVEAFRRFGPLAPTLAVLAVDLAYRHWINSELSINTLSAQEQYVLCYSLFGRSFEFAAGMCAAYLVVRQTHSLQKVFIGILLISGTAAVLVTNRTGTFSTFPDVLWGVCFASLVIAGALPNRISHLLSQPLLVRLGIFSYSVYLIHQPILKILDRIAMHFHIPTVAMGLFVIIPVVIGLGYVFHLLFEKPFMTSPKARPEQDTVKQASEVPVVTGSEMRVAQEAVD